MSWARGLNPLFKRKSYYRKCSRLQVFRQTHGNGGNTQRKARLGAAHHPIERELVIEAFDLRLEDLCVEGSAVQ